jgi:hypothetical protein
VWGFNKVGLDGSDLPIIGCITIVPFPIIILYPETIPKKYENESLKLCCARIIIIIDKHSIDDDDMHQYFRSSSKLNIWYIVLESI